MSDTKIDIDDICGALGVDYNPAFSTHHYLRMIYELSLRKNYPAPPPQVLRSEGDDFRSDAVALAKLVNDYIVYPPDTMTLGLFRELHHLARKLTGEQEYVPLCQHGIRMPDPCAQCQEMLAKLSGPPQNRRVA